MTKGAASARSGDIAAQSRAQFAMDVRYYLAQDPRQLPSRYLYDALGSALFEAICRLPWYGLTRAEARLLERHAADIFAAAAPLAQLVELGPGSGDKLALFLAAARPQPHELDVHLIDISPAALAQASRAIGAHQRVEVVTHHATYERGLADVALARRGGGRTLVLFLGSNVGNFDPPGAEALLRTVRAGIKPGDFLLVGADLVKAEADLLLAYDDPLGVTAAFNRNLLVRINAELGGNFDLDRFAHRAVWRPSRSRVEMHLVSTHRQCIRIPMAQLEFEMADGEPIWTESSYKYRPAAVTGLLEQTGCRVAAQWVDDADAFALTLAEAVR